MSKRLLIGNLSLETDESSIAALFARAGRVQSVILIADLQSGRKKGFAFVDMSKDADAAKAVELLDGEEIDGRTIIVNLSDQSDPPAGTSFIARCIQMLRR